MRQSELFGLAPNDIFLDEVIPYVWVRRRKGYSLKTLESKRKIPLVGGALVAFTKFPHGFRHLGNEECFSAAINNFLTVNNLMPTEEQSAYLLRHTFKDRLRDYGDVRLNQQLDVM